MASDDDKYRPVPWSVGDLCPAPNNEPERDGVRWLRVKGTDVVPDPYRDVRLRFELRASSWVWSGLFLLADELRAQELAERFPLARIVADAAASLALLTDAEPPRVTAQRRRGRLGNSDEFLGQVAELYRYALLHPEHRRAPVTFIREQQDLWRDGQRPHEDTVRSWVRQARRRGFLGASIPGKAGELPTSSPEGDKPREDLP